MERFNRSNKATSWSREEVMDYLQTYLMTDNLIHAMEDEIQMLENAKSQIFRVDEPHLYHEKQKANYSMTFSAVTGFPGLIAAFVQEIHGTFEGSVYGNNVGNGRLFTIHDFNMCTGFMIGGHVHHPGCFSGYFYYCGNPYRWKFGEEEDKGFLICVHDLDTNRHYVHFEKIISHQYITISLKDIISKDPQQVIAYIDDLKRSRGIDYLKIKFEYPIDGSDKVILNNYYRNNHNIFVEFLDIIEEQKLKAESNGVLDSDFGFILDDKLTDMEKFVRYVNTQEGCEFITVDRLKEILSEGI